MQLRDLVQPTWPPLRHIEAGWAALTEEEQKEVHARLEAVDTTAHGRRDATLPFFAFLAQVETIAIEIPLRFLKEAPEDLQPLLRRQLVDEVFHSLLFARIAHQLALPEALPPQPSEAAEELLTLIRNETNWESGVTLLNLAECWIENLFRHAASWQVAPDVFKTVLIDEARHVEEAFHANCPDAVAALETGLMKLFQEPVVALAMHELSGSGYMKMARGLRDAHRKHLAKLGLEPGPEWQLYEAQLDGDIETAALVEEGPWRATANQIWTTPRDPTMQGDFDANVAKIPKKLLTPAIVAAVGRAWAKHPELNRVHAKGRTYQLEKANVGVRVLVNGQLGTVVVEDADKRSLADISQCIRDGVATLEAQEGTAPVNEDAIKLLTPTPASFSVAVSNPGKFGLVRGAGALSGYMSPSTDISIGQRRRVPTWKGIGYFPTWHTNFGCLQDHRVFDGREAGIAMTALQQELRTVKTWLKTKSTVLPQQMQILPTIGKYSPVAVGAGMAAVAAGAAAAGFAIHHLVKQDDVDEEE